MKAKTIYMIVAVIILVVIILGVWSIMTQKQPVVIDLNQLNTTISEQTPFHEMAMMDMTADTLSTVYDISTEDIEEVVGKMPLMNVHASMYLIVKAKDGKVNSVKEQIEKIGDSEEQKWENYLPEQYALVKNRKIGVRGNYIYFIISENATDIEKLIK
ncbi:MAG: DUF4358 domain-containing protein [Clostridia bacterium]